MGQVDSFTKDVSFWKVDDDLGLILGFAIISKENGEDHFDLQGDHIPEEAMLKATFDFAQGSRRATNMHKVDDGEMVFLFPLTTEIAKSLEIETRFTGLLVGYKPENPETLEKAKNGELQGFSIGGKRGVDIEVDE